MNRILIIVIALSVNMNCKEQREIKYSGFDDLVVGSETIKLYKNGDFDLELGLGYESGKYTMNKDTVNLYFDSSNDMPHQFILTETKFISIDKMRTIEIDRTDKNRSNTEIPQGHFTYEIYFAEFEGRMPNRTCTVKIDSDHIHITQDKTTNLTGGKTIYEGKVIQHKSGKWILTNNDSDKQAIEIGGCTGIPIIDLDKQIIEWC